MRTSKLTKRMMQAALLLGASRGYVGDSSRCLGRLKSHSSIAVGALAYSAMSTQAIPLTLTTGICLGAILVPAVLSSVVKNGKTSILQKISILLLLIGIMYLEWYTWPTAIICIIGVVESIFFILNREHEPVELCYSNGAGFTERIATRCPRMAWVVLLTEGLINIVATICTFMPISVFGIPVALILLYLRFGIMLISTLQNMPQLKQFWIRLGLAETPPPNRGSDA